MKRFLFIFSALALISFGWGMRALNRVEMSEELLPQEIYVWQQDWSSGVLDSFQGHAARFSNSVLLASEIRWKNGRPILKQVDLPLELLANSGNRQGMAIRIGVYRGSFATNASATIYIENLIRKNLEEWKRSGLEPSEVQLDFDCPESRLGDYLKWVRHFKTVSNPTPLTLTALPSWLDRKAFREIANVSNGYVLQVHSFEHPKHPSSAVTLCDPEVSIRYVEKAARLGRPFRVALPTYGYRLFYDDDNALLGIAAEGSTDEWPKANAVRELRANSREMASLVSRWNEEHPSALEGIIWFRMPVPQDSLNWSWSELLAVTQGRAPRTDWVLTPVNDGTGLVEIIVENNGETEIPLPSIVRANWTANRLIASDGLNSFQLLETDPNELALRTDRQLMLAPNRSRVIAWLRFDQPTEVNIDEP